MIIRKILNQLLIRKTLTDSNWWRFVIGLLPRGVIWRHIYSVIPGEWQDTIATPSYTHDDNTPPITHEDNPSITASPKMSKFSILLSVFASELNRFWDRYETFINESVYGNSVEMLPDWERVAGLPDECLTDLSAYTIEERQDIVHQKLTQGKTDPDSVGVNNSADFYIKYAANLGYTITISYGGGPFRVGDRVGDRLGSSGDLYTWIVSGTYDSFLQCLFERDKPAYSIIIWA